MSGRPAHGGGGGGGGGGGSGGPQKAPPAPLRASAAQADATALPPPLPPFRPPQHWETRGREAERVVTEWEKAHASVTRERDDAARDARAAQATADAQRAYLIGIGHAGGAAAQQAARAPPARS